MVWSLQHQIRDLCHDKQDNQCINSIAKPKHADSEQNNDAIHDCHQLWNGYMRNTPVDDLCCHIRTARGRILQEDQAKSATHDHAATQPIYQYITGQKRQWTDQSEKHRQTHRRIDCPVKYQLSKYLISYDKQRNIDRRINQPQWDMKQMLQ